MAKNKTTPFSSKEGSGSAEDKKPASQATFSKKTKIAAGLGFMATAAAAAYGSTHGTSSDSLAVPTSGEGTTGLNLRAPEQEASGHALSSTKNDFLIKGRDLSERDLSGRDLGRKKKKNKKVGKNPKPTNSPTFSQDQGTIITPNQIGTFVLQPGETVTVDLSNKNKNFPTHLVFTSGQVKAIYGLLNGTPSTTTSFGSGISKKPTIWLWNDPEHVYITIPLPNGQHRIVGGVPCHQCTSEIHAPDVTVTYAGRRLLEEGNEFLDDTDLKNINTMFDRTGNNTGDIKIDSMDVTVSAEMMQKMFGKGRRLS